MDNKRPKSSPGCYTDHRGNIGTRLGHEGYTSQKEESGIRRLGLNSNRILPSGHPENRDCINLQRMDHDKTNCGTVNNSYNGMKETTFMTYDDCTLKPGGNDLMENKSKYHTSQSNNSDVTMTDKVEQQYLKFAQAELLKHRQIELFRRQSSSCDSISPGSVTSDSRPLLHRYKSRTSGNLSINSQSGFENQAYLGSSGHSVARLSSQESADSFNSNGRDEKTDGPNKKMRRYESQFSDDFVVNSRTVNAPVIQKHQKAKVNQQLASGALKCVSMENVTQKSVNGRTEGTKLQYDRLKSFNSDDLQLVDIEDLESEGSQQGTLVHNSPVFRNQSKSTTQLNNTERDLVTSFDYDSMSVNSRSVLLCDKENSFSYYDNGTNMARESLESVRFTSLASSSNIMVRKPAWHSLESEDIEMSELNSDSCNGQTLSRHDYYTYSKQQGDSQNDKTHSQQQQKFAKSDKSKEQFEGKYGRDNESYSHFTATSNSLLKGAGVKAQFTGDSLDEAVVKSGLMKMFSQPNATPTHYVMMVLGGKEARSKDFAVKPLSMWKLEIKF